MSSLAVLNFEEQEIRFVDGKPVANDVAKVLGYKDPVNTIRKKVKDKNKGVARMPTNGGSQLVTVLANEEGVLDLVSSSRMPKAEELCARLGIKVSRAYQEPFLIEVLAQSFPDLEPIRQYKVGAYRVDLYLRRANIVIECDEDGHSTYSAKAEKERQLFIIETLDCQILRFNPDEQGFNIGCVIWQIRKMLGLPDGSK